MKKLTTFATFNAKNSFKHIAVIAIFMAISLSHSCVANNKFGYQILAGYDTCVITVLGGTGGDSLFCLYSNFSFAMPRTMKNASTVNNSNFTSTSSHETATSVATIQLQCSNPYSIPTFEDFLNKLHEEYEIEKNAKNTAYYFILFNNLFDEFAEFCKNYHSSDPHKDCLESLLSKI